MTPEELKKAQDEMLEDATRYGRPNRLGAIVLKITSDCTTCAFLRGAFLGAVVVGAIWYLI